MSPPIFLSPCWNLRFLVAHPPKASPALFLLPTALLLKNQSFLQEKALGIQTFVDFPATFSRKSSRTPTSIQFLESPELISSWGGSAFPGFLSPSYPSLLLALALPAGGGWSRAAERCQEPRTFQGLYAQAWEVYRGFQASLPLRSPQQELGSV